MERQIRRQKFVKNAVLVLAIILFVGIGIMLSKVSGRTNRVGPGNLAISADNLALNDANGINRLWIGEREGQVRVELRDSAGRRRLSLGLDAAGGPQLIFYNKDGKVLTQIVSLPNGQSGIELLNQAGKPIATIAGPITKGHQVISPSPAPLPPSKKPSPEMPKVEQKAVPKPETAVNTAKPVIFVANKGGKYFHLPSSPWVKNTPTAQLLKFSSAAEAEKAGFRPGLDVRSGLKR